MSFKMPPLPEPQKVCWIGHTLFSDEQMHAYGRAVLEAVAAWLRDPEGAAETMNGWAIEQRMAGAMLLVNISNELRAAAKEQQT